MTADPRQKRGQLKAWLYLSIFGVDEDAETAVEESQSAQTQEDDYPDRSPPDR